MLGGGVLMSESPQRARCCWRMLRQSRTHLPSFPTGARELGYLSTAPSPVCPPPPHPSPGQGCSRSGFALRHFLSTLGLVPAARGRLLEAMGSSCPGVR